MYIYKFFSFLTFFYCTNIFFNFFPKQCIHAFLFAFWHFTYYCIGSIYDWNSCSDNQRIPGSVKYSSWVLSCKILWRYVKVKVQGSDFIYFTFAIGLYLWLLLLIITWDFHFWLCLAIFFQFGPRLNVKVMT